MNRRGKNKNEKQKSNNQIIKDNNEELLWINRPVFSGFLGGNVFITKKGFRSMKMDSLWVQNLLEAFKNDDDELAMICLESSIASVQDTVEGGSYGSPYCIGDYGFYAEEQFEAQLTHIKQSTRNWCIRKKHYLSATEWEILDTKLTMIAYHGKASFHDTCRGDTFAALAIRQNAFLIAKLFVNKGVDPLIQNEKQQDLFQIMKIQYQVLNTRLKSIQAIKNEAINTILVPTVVTHILHQENLSISQYHALSLFANELKSNFYERMKQIEIDKLLKRRAELRDEEFSDHKIWNIAQQKKLEIYIPEIEQLKSYIEEKLKFHEIETKKFQNLAEILIANYNLIHQDETDSLSIQSITTIDKSNNIDNTVDDNIDNNAINISTDDDKANESNEIYNNVNIIINNNIDDNNINSINQSIDNNMLLDDVAMNRNEDLLTILSSKEIEIAPIMSLSITKNNLEASSFKYSLPLLVIPTNTTTTTNKNSNIVTKIDELPQLNNNMPLTPASINLVSSSLSLQSLIIKSNNKNNTNNNAIIRKQYYDIKLNNDLKPTLKSKEELFNKLGYASNNKKKKSSNNNNDINNVDNDGSKAQQINKLVSISTKDQYLPTLGILNEDENSVTMYR